MKKSIIAIVTLISIVLVTLLFATSCEKATTTATTDREWHEDYVKTMLVVRTNRSDFVDTLEDKDGNLFQIVDFEGKYFEGDYVNCTFDNNGTCEIEDDIIVTASYSGVSKL